ncbi:hypothetical protein [Sediminicurvatus halobius]|uniref:Aminoglycoside phosphotransferase domain-containing protein n=1 Tax=Sediminicurvatus halobius TaxID=2182432 RepID=A0A2U2MX11_9GAMM|nr:hypothetical protein [Spiribacter halobius]PWG61405.1 hypothetical protein DEM34_16685 [Spiribacter halobius]UEX78536.1 hypothetical protein LMH63_02520 [Spiribacter halobius]
MSRESDRIDARIDALRTDRLPATLVSSDGYHCEVWRCAGSVRRDGQRETRDFVIKVPRVPFTAAEVRVMRREHRRLRDALGDIVPETLYVIAHIDGVESVVALAPTISRWFDIANPANEAEARPLLERMPRARAALCRFIEVAEAWYQSEERVIDLYGLENLVLDRNRHLHYIDSFGVFFHADVLNALPDPDPGLAERIELSRRRLEYLRDLLV